ncbi:something about silencing protein 10-like isoform X1 [Antedon mediterranea]|uniref:something about silencing protein 10-like isoform X1 n=1 Tax=Antedon mediterranea TaxID=105859 RepID=UPI003AF9B718
MKKKGRGPNKFKKKEETFDSDDERMYKDLPVPDFQSSVYDEIDDFHKQKLKRMKKHIKEQERGSTDDEMEVLSLDSEDEDDYEAQLMAIKKQAHLDDVASDMEDEDDENNAEDALPNNKSWGTHKKSFYHTDYVDDDLPGLSDEEEEQAEEEKEALAIQQRMVQDLDEEDFAMDLFKVDKTDDVESQIVKDLSKISKKEKLQHLEKDSPELFLLIEEFKTKINELISSLHPLLCMVKSRCIPSGESAVYITTKFHLYLNYCMNVSLYLALKAKQVSIRNHPILTRILAYKNLIQELKPIDEQLSGDIEMLVKMENVNKYNGNDEDIQQMKSKYQPRKSDKKRENLTTHDADTQGVGRKTANKTAELTDEELAALHYYRLFEEKAVQKKPINEELASELKPDVVDDEDDGNEDGKRAITYQMSKNKGLTVKKKKEQRNPRVKHRMKFRRAKIRRKGQVREPTTEKKRYSGEASGIRSAVIKSVKIR